MKQLCTALVATGLLSACQTVTGPMPAVMETTSDAEMASLKATLSEALGRTNIELGAADLTQASSFTVLPPGLSPLETNSTAMPTQFELMIQGGDTCYVLHVEENMLHRVDGISCVAAEPIS